MNAIQTHFWAVRDYLAPVLRESKFKEHGRITPEEFVAAGDFLSYKFPTWSWAAGEASKTRDFLPKDKQYLISRGVPCLRRVSQIENAALGGKRSAGGSASTGAPDEKLLSFADGQDGTDGTGGDDDWLATHIDDQGTETSQVGEIADMPDTDAHVPAGAALLSQGEEDNLANQVAGLSMGVSGGVHDIADGGDDDDEGEVGDIPDEDDVLDSMAGAGVEEHDDLATAAPTASKQPAQDRHAPGSSSGNILSVRTYDCLITYDKYYQTPRMWLVGYDESGVPLKPSQIFEDISSDYAQKTVTIEPFPHSATMSTASVHPCKHASVMKKVIERMDAGVKEEQKKIKQQQQSPDAAAAGSASVDEKQKKKKWGLGGAMKKVASRSTSGGSAAASAATGGAGGTATAPGGSGSPGSPGEDGPVEVEGLRVDQYLLVFLKFMASIVPAIEIDATQSF
ncbi:unnamed protein product [Parajaminaea phylloscopi]